MIRFSNIVRKIFEQLDNQTLVKCKKVNRSWNNILNQNKLISIRIIQRYNENHVEFRDDWNSVVKKVDPVIIKQLAIAVKEFYANKYTYSPRLDSQHSPLHIIADQGLLPLYELFYSRVRIKNPKRSHGSTKGIYYKLAQIIYPDNHLSITAAELRLHMASK